MSGTFVIANAERAARRCSAVGARVSALALIAIFWSAPAHATHGRATILTWSPVAAPPANTVEFTVTGAWRRSAYSTANGRCRDVSLGSPSVAPPSKPCSGPDGFPAVGDVIVENQAQDGATTLNTGQGSIGSPGGNGLLYIVTSIDPTNDWLYGTALDPNSLPAVDTTIRKTYTNTASRIADIEECCRIEASAGLVNNAEGTYRVETLVTPGSANHPPVSTMVPIVTCLKNSLCTFQIPASDPDNDPLTWRLSTSTEAGGSSGFVQPGPPYAPNAAAVNSVTGAYSWDTTGATIKPSGPTYYSTQVSIEDHVGTTGGTIKSKIAVDFLIQLVDAPVSVPPEFVHPPTPDCGSTIGVTPSGTVNFTVEAQDDDVGQTVTLNAVGVPVGATLTPALPTTGNPVSTNFSWTPGLANAGTTNIVSFTATDNTNLTAECDLTIQVSTCATNADCNDGSACTTDICDASDPNADAAGCVHSTLCDACQTCDVMLGCMGTACTPTRTFTSTATATATSTATGTATNTGTPTRTETPTPTGADTATPTATPQNSPTATETGTATATGTHTFTSTATFTVTETPTPTNTPEPFCGDGHVDPGESCDDGNQTDNDGCDSDCTQSDKCVPVYPGVQHFVGPCDASSVPDIQTAIDAASDGDIIIVCNGTYTQPLTVTKEVNIQVAGGNLVTVHTTGTAFDVRRSGVNIEGFIIQSDSGSAISANNICPPGQSSCASPGHGSNLIITKNTIQNSPIGIGWQRRIDCAQITENTMTDNQRHIELHQQEGVPAVLVGIVSNTISGGGDTGSAVSLSGLGASVANNTIQNSINAGLVLANMPGGMATQVIENNIAANTTDGITVRPGADGVAIHDNNITNNAVGLGNESGAGTLDARENWWNSQTGPSGLFTGHGDSIENRGAGSTTTFIEFLCKPFPQGFPSIGGVCSTEVPELRQLIPGRSPDFDPFARYIVFESSADLDTDERTSVSNPAVTDASLEVFLLNRRPKGKLAGVCLGGLNGCDFDNLPSCMTCNGSKECPGDPDADPIVLNGECVIVTQLSDGQPPYESDKPRITGRGKYVVFPSTAPQLGGNPDGSREIISWTRPAFEKNKPPAEVYLTDAAPPVDYDNPAPSLSGRRVFVESNGNPMNCSNCDNTDGNTEIFVLDVLPNEWRQITHTPMGIDNRRPATVDGKRVVFDSNGDLVPGENPDGNRELFLARLRSGGIEITQITHTGAGIDNRSGSLDGHSVVIAFSSNGDFTGGNADGNREIFTWHRKTQAFEQITNSPSGENANPMINQTQRFVVFESTADLTASGATNRRVFQFDRAKGTLTLLSRSRVGTNQRPRIRHRRFVVWESTANLTGNNPPNPNNPDGGGEWVIYLFDRKKD